MITETEGRFYPQCEDCGWTGRQSGYDDKSSAQNALNRHGPCTTPTEGTTTSSSPMASPMSEDMFAQILSAYGVSSKIQERILWLFRANARYQREPGQLSNMLTGQGITMNKSRQIVDEYFSMAMNTQGGGPNMPMYGPPQQQPMGNQFGMQGYGSGSYCQYPQNPMMYNQGGPVMFANPKGPPVIMQKKRYKVPLMDNGVPRTDAEGNAMYQIVEEDIPVMPTSGPNQPSFMEYANAMKMAVEMVKPGSTTGATENPKMAELEQRLDNERELRHKAEMERSEKENEKNLALLVREINDLKGRIIDPFQALEAWEDRARRMGFSKEITGKTTMDILDGLRKDVHEGFKMLAGSTRRGKRRVVERPRRTEEQKQAIVQRIHRDVDNASETVEMENEIMEMTRRGEIQPYAAGEGE